MKQWIQSKSIGFQLFLMVAFIVANLSCSILLAHLILNDVKIGGKKFNGIELKLLTIDNIARMRMNTNFLRARMLDQLLDYDEETASTLVDIAGRLQEQVAEMQKLLQDKGNNTQPACAFCHTPDDLAAISTHFQTVGRSMANISKMIKDDLLPALEAEDEERAIEIIEENFNAAYIEVMTESKPVVDAMREATEYLKASGLKFADLAIRLYAFFGILAIIFVCLFSWLLVRMIIKTVTSATSSLSRSSREISDQAHSTSESSMHVAEMSSEMAASIEEISASIEEITSMGRQNAENAEMANTLMHQAKDTNDLANSHMREMLLAMKEIKKDSEAVAGIINDIEGIAFQTNLLALNAAVEAARAGEHGAGFAVVADEVRNLARRASDAAKTSQERIEQAKKRVDDGLGMLESVAKELAEGTELSIDAAQRIDSITTASREQSQSIAQINTGISGMDKGTQQLAANSEETASSSQAVLSQVAVLDESVEGLNALLKGKNR